MVIGFWVFLTKKCLFYRPENFGDIFYLPASLTRYGGDETLCGYMDQQQRHSLYFI